MADEITNDPVLHALARSIRATFARHDLWRSLPATDQIEYLGYALTQREWLRRLGCVVTSGCKECPFNER
jgi:hypothetical protein